MVSFQHKASILVGILFLHSVTCFFAPHFQGHVPSTRRFSSLSLVQMTATLKEMVPINEKYPLQNDLIIRAAKGEEVERTPVWLFRQAGRHLPEYMDYKEQKNKNFLELLKDPTDVAEVTMQPIRRYEVDAAILFSDILVVPEALGIDVEMPGGKGIVVPRPLTGPEDLSRLRTDIDIRQELSHVIESVTAIKEELKGKVPLIGFSAAPWTLMYYMVGGSSKKNPEAGESWLRDHPEESKQLLNLLTDVVIEYMVAQVEAGADLLQVFEAMGMFISEKNFDEWCLPVLTRMCKELKERCPGVPLMVFARGATYANVALQQAGFDVVTLDGSTPRQETRQALFEAAKGGRVASVQGNFNPCLLAEGSEAEIKEEIEIMLQALSPQKYIANLGEGLMGKEKPELVKYFVDTIHEVSESMIAEKSAQQ
mmetsp:Transcript_33284/g.43892  ORF Transcript_33284/g.43892 Transcript_33284/m.43892 type:complete len:425 (-) Transcript_33284:320-1594(-)|eukprot:CAMPEP_0117757894 /NCGR_PEP_ID=MMETSP0947-20121206/15026_1 /TAXON_ID=44440 /ORGANISM="Chattonella subsalsa, Strain CCMP2191" /LENGTH=424 /DNA_ID=CAMNT_0005577921 /DNA_START=71 /DNA_END=1345 /DNA_ORIENTATION=+